MAVPKENPLMEKIVSLCKRRGFIFQSSEIYGGINGFWDYGPLGAELKRNVKDLWWRRMTQDREDVIGLDATIIMLPKVWQASGHVDTFADLMRECPLTKKRVRADQVEEQSGNCLVYSGAAPQGALERMLGEIGFHRDSSSPPDWVVDAKFVERHLHRFEDTNEVVGVSGVSEGEFFDALDRCTRRKVLSDYSHEGFSVMLPLGKPANSARKIAKEFYEQKGIKSPVLIQEEMSRVENSTDFHPESGVRLGPARPFNLMFKTHYGPVESDENIAYLRPETAQAIFVQFKNVLETSRQKIPFGIAQMGKAFRNEVTPRNFTFRSREFEQMELEYFIRPDEAVEAIAGSVASVEEAFGVPPSGGSEPAEAGTPNPQSNWGWEAWHKYWVEERIRFYESIGLPRETLVEYWQAPEELAHYARATVDILYKFPFSKQDEKGELKGEELEGVAARSDFDLSQHQRFSGKSMMVFDEELKTAWAQLTPEKQTELSERYYQGRLKYLTKAGESVEKAERTAHAEAEGLARGNYIPHVIEPSAGADRLVLALLCNAYSEDEAPNEKGMMESRVVLRFHPRIAPIKVAIFPLLKNKPELVSKAKEVRDLLRPHMAVFYDEGGAIGRRYRRQDEVGTPFGVTIDFDTIGENGPELKDTVTLRERDSMKQERVKISDLTPLLLQKVR